MVVVIAASLGGSEGGGGAGSTTPAKTQQGERSNAPMPKSYVVQNGDTLTSIARKTGVPIARILRLNPGVDPQILISGEKLKLR